jgi:hypothetical protein
VVCIAEGVSVLVTPLRIPHIILSCQRIMPLFL